MKAPTADKLLSFGGAAGALGVAAVVARFACPGQCPTCAGCTQTILPAASAALAVGTALGGSYVVRTRRNRRSRDS